MRKDFTKAVAFKLGLGKKGHDVNKWKAKDQMWEVLQRLTGELGVTRGESQRSGGSVDQDSDPITGAQQELGNVTDRYGGGRGLGQVSWLIPHCALLLEGRSGALLCPAPTPNPTAKFLPTGTMEGVSIFTCLK